MRLAVIAFALVVLAACSEPAAPAREAGARQPILFGETVLIESSVYGTPREVNIYAPERPSWIEEPLPVVYVIDGGLDQDYFHIAGLSQLTLINGERVPTIIVGIKTENRRAEIVPPAKDLRYLEEFGDYGGAEDFRRFLVDEVRPAIESRFDVGPSAVMGESLAGLFVADTFLRAPESFDDYVAVSPSLWWDDRRLTEEAPALLAGHTPGRRRLYLTMANEGGTMQLGMDELVAALGQAEVEGLEFVYVDRSGSDSHATIYHQAARDALGWLYGLPPYPEGELPWYLDPSEGRPTPVQR